MTKKQKNLVDKVINILDIDKDNCNFSFNFSFQGKEYSFDTRMIRLPDSNKVFFSPIVLKKKVLNFNQLKNVSVDLFCMRNMEKPIIWHDIKLDLIHLDKKTSIYQFQGNYYGTEVNRRNHFRMFLGKSGEAQIGLHSVPVPVIIKDISASGISIISNENREEEEIHVTFNDREINSHFSIRASVVRVSRMENGRYIYGCQFGEEKEAIEDYIQKRQRYDLQSRRK